MNYPKIYYSLTEIKSRGWTAEIMRDTGLECAAQVTNIHRRDRPVQLFAIEEVTRLEKTEQFQKAIAENEARRKERRAR